MVYEYDVLVGILRLLLQKNNKSWMATIKEDTISNVLKVHFHVKYNSIMVLSESKLSL